MHSLIAYLPVIAVAIVAVWFYRSRARQLAQQRTTVLWAITSYALVLLILAAVLSMLTIDYAHGALGGWPSLGPRTWSVADAHAAYVGVWLAFALAGVSILVASWRFLVAARARSNARAF